MENKMLRMLRVLADACFALSGVFRLHAEEIADGAVDAPTDPPGPKPVPDPEPPQPVTIPPMSGGTDREARNLFFAYVEDDQDKGLDVGAEIGLIRKADEWLLVAKTYQGGRWDETPSKGRKAQFRLGDTPVPFEITGTARQDNTLRLELRKRGDSKASVKNLQLPDGGLRAGDLATKKGGLLCNNQGNLPKHPNLWDGARLAVVIDADDAVELDGPEVLRMGPTGKLHSFRLEFDPGLAAGKDDDEVDREAAEKAAGIVNLPEPSFGQTYEPKNGEALNVRERWNKLPVSLVARYYFEAIMLARQDETEIPPQSVDLLDALSRTAIGSAVFEVDQAIENGRHGEHALVQWLARNTPTAND